MLEVKEFLRLLKASEKTLHEHTKVILLTFVISIMAIKSNFFSNNCYKFIFSDCLSAAIENNLFSTTATENKRYFR